MNLQKHTKSLYDTRKNIEKSPSSKVISSCHWTSPLANISVLILAGGSSSRFKKKNFSKLLLSLKGKTILEHSVASALSAKPLEVVVVLGHLVEKHKKVLPKKEVKIVINRDFKKGISTSIKTGIEALSSNTSAVIIAQADKPFIKPEVYFSLASVFRNNETAICIPTYEGKRGNPVLFPKHLFQKLCTLKGDKGGKVLFQKPENKIVEVPIDNPTVTIDIDTKEDYTRILDSLVSF